MGYTFQMIATKLGINFQYHYFFLIFFCLSLKLENPSFTLAVFCCREIYEVCVVIRA